MGEPDRDAPLFGLPPIARALRVSLASHSQRLAADGAARAGVLVALFAGPDGEARLWLLRRPESLRSHAGQVALPGGKSDPCDPDLVATALREADEEIGLPARAVEVLGIADDLSTRTGYVITPVVAWIVEPFTLRENPHEVARTFTASLATFREEGMLGLVPIEALRRLARAYRVDGEIVWGATAAILHALARRA